MEERASEVEHNLLVEIERLQSEVEAAKQGAEMVCHTADSLRLEVASLEALITEKKHQVENLVADMKEANLQSLTVAPSEEHKLLVEGRMLDISVVIIVLSKSTKVFEDISVCD